MINGKKQQSLFSNPLILFLVGGGITLIAVVLAVMILQPSGLLKTATYSSSSPTSVDTKEQCECTCESTNGRLCAVPWEDNGDHCPDYNYEYSDITDSSKCEDKEGGTCRGYFDSKRQIRGKLDDCKIVTSPKTTSTAIASPDGDDDVDD